MTIKSSAAGSGGVVAVLSTIGRTKKIGYLRVSLENEEGEELQYCGSFNTRSNKLKRFAKRLIEICETKD